MTDNRMARPKTTTTTVNRELVYTKGGPELHIHTTTWMVWPNGNREELSTRTRVAPA